MQPQLRLPGVGIHFLQWGKPSFTTDHQQINELKLNQIWQYGGLCRIAKPLNSTRFHLKIPSVANLY